MTNNFPLFRLPYVALHEVLNHVGPEVILPLSLCSKRSKHFVKICQGPRKEIQITLHVPENVLKVNYESLGTAVSISVAAVSEQPANLKTVIIGSHVVPVQMKYGILKTYWMDRKLGLKEVIKHTSDVFSRDIYSIEGCDAVSSEDAKHWLTWVKTSQGKLRQLFLSSGVDDGLLMYILESDIVTGDLILHSHCSPGFRGPSPRPYSIDHLYLMQAKWVTLDHLVAMDIKRIVLYNSPLAVQGINSFLKKWINGECSKRIKQLYVGMKNEVSYDVLMEGIEVNRRDPSLKRYYDSPNLVEPINGGFDVRRKEDGAMATIINRSGELTILFWPDDKGNPYY